MNELLACALIGSLIALTIGTGAILLILDPRKDD